MNFELIEEKEEQNIILEKNSKHQTGKKRLEGYT